MNKTYCLDIYSNGKRIKKRKYRRLKDRDEALLYWTRQEDIVLKVYTNRPKLKNLDQRRINRKQWKIDLAIYKLVRGCKYCGGDNELTFHHRRKKVACATQNRFTTATALWNEVYKCEVVCRECHDKIHNEGMPQLVDFHPYWIICRS